MPQTLKKLSESFVKSVLDTGYYVDGGGLYLQISRVGTKRWVYRFALASRTREMGLGSVRDVALSQARQKAAEARVARECGVDPIEARREQIAAQAPAPFA
jgi:Arm DNA-binding domain